MFEMKLVVIIDLRQCDAQDRRLPVQEMPCLIGSKSLEVQHGMWT